MEVAAACVYSCKHTVVEVAAACVYSCKHTVSQWYLNTGGLV